MGALEARTMLIVRLTSYFDSGLANGLPHSTEIALESHWCANSFGFSSFQMPCEL